jgi:hypothetical protein
LYGVLKKLPKPEVNMKLNAAQKNGGIGLVMSLLKQICFLK